MGGQVALEAFLEPLPVLLFPLLGSDLGAVAFGFLLDSALGVVFVFSLLGVGVLLWLGVGDFRLVFCHP